MPIYVARINDGSCLVGEAENEAEARENFLWRWNDSEPEPDELILSIREMPKDTFLTRWWPTEFPDDDELPGGLDGGVAANCDICENEYPLIAEAHARGSEQIANSSDAEDALPFLTKWEKGLKKALSKAVRAEMRRGTIQSKNVQ